MAIKHRFTPFQQVSQGFTLVELMVALLLSVFVVFSVYTVFRGQQKVQLAQTEVVETQQNLRAVMDLLARDIRMAGYNPTGDAVAGISEAKKGRITITKDTSDDSTGCPNVPDGSISDTKCEETVTYGFSDTDDANKDGIPDSGEPETFRRANTVSAGSPVLQPIADLIQAVEFVYLDSEGEVTTTLSDIMSVQISILARSEKPDHTYTDSKDYKTASGTTWSAYDDNYRRRLLTQTVYCRNLGI